MSNKQIQLFSVDTKAFHNEEELKLSNTIFDIENKIETIETCEKIKYLLQKGCIIKIFNIEINNFDFGEQFYNEYDKQYNDFRNLQNKEKEDETFLSEEEKALLKNYNELFRFIKKLLKNNKYSLKNSEDYNKQINSAKMYKESEKSYKDYGKKLRDILNSNINSKRGLNKSYCYDVDENGNMTPKSYRQISFFTSYLSDVLG